jgi:uncharacterized protein (TIGR02217 family)
MPTKFVDTLQTYGPGHRTTKFTAAAGADRFQQHWSQAQRQYVSSIGNLPTADIEELVDFVLARKGAAFSFDIQDPNDFTTAANHIDVHTPFDVTEGPTKETGTFVMPIYKRYADDTRFEVTRRLHKVEQILVGVDGIQVTEGVAFSLTKSPATINWIIPPGQGSVVTWGAIFHTRVRFNADLDQWLRAIRDVESGSTELPLIEEKVAGQILTLDDVDRLRPNALAEGAHGVTGPLTNVEFSQGFIHFFNPAGFTVVRLPPVLLNGEIVGFDSRTPKGGPHFWIFNQSATNKLVLFEYFPTGTSAGTIWQPIQAGGPSTVENNVIGPGQARKLWLTFDSRWRAF